MVRPGRVRIQTVAAGFARRISSKSWRIAPVPPGSARRRSRSAAPRRRGRGRPSPRRSRDRRAGRHRPWFLLLEQPRLRRLDRAHHRGAAVGVLVDADAEVELVAARVGGKRPRSSMILSAGGLQRLEHGVSSGQASIMSRSRRQHPRPGLAAHRDEARLLVERQRTRVVERVGVDRDPPRPRPVPGHVQRGVQQERPEAAADRLGHQPEVGEVAGAAARGCRGRRSRVASRRASACRA